MEAAAEAAAAVVAARLPAFLDYAYATVSTGGGRKGGGGSQHCFGHIYSWLGSVLLACEHAGAISNKFYKLFKFLFMQRCKVKPADS